MYFIRLAVKDSPVPVAARSKALGLRPLACWDCGFDSRRGHGCVSCECYVLSSRGLCDRLITRPEQSYQTWCVVVYDIETSWMRRPWFAFGRSATRKNYEGEASFIAYFSIYLCFLPNEDLMERRIHVTAKSINECTVFKCSVCVDLNRHYKNNLQSCIVYGSDRVLVNGLKSWCSTHTLQIIKTLKNCQKTRFGNQIPYLPAQTYCTAWAQIQVTTPINFQC